MGKKISLNLKVLAVLTVLLMVVSCTAVLYNGTERGEERSESGRGKSIISLLPPPFIVAASAAEVAGEGAFPEHEAGICAYVNTDRRIDLNRLKTIYTEVEKVGDNYIIGKTHISNFGGDINVTVYADTSGWIVAYFKADEPASKIMQWLPADPDTPRVSIATTTLRDALRKAGTAAGVPVPDAGINYYDFRYPNANAMTIVVRTIPTHGTNIMQIEIPTDYTLYEASYYHYITIVSPHGWSVSSTSELKVDGGIISSISVSGILGRFWNRAFGSYAGTIETRILNKIEISCKVDSGGSAGVATVLIYRKG